MSTIRKFGKELQPAFEVHENCYNCADFYAGCTGWQVSRDFDCRRYCRLPDVLPGTSGQRFPASHRKAPVDRALRSSERQAAESSRPPAREPDVETPPLVDVPPKNTPISQPDKPVKPPGRICGCGVPLPKGKRLCDGCRVEARRQTKRQYMRTYMRQRRSGVIGSDSDMLFPAQSTHVARGGGEDRPLTGHPVGVSRCEQTFVLTEGVSQISGFLR
jgi:hypothetical protein